MVHGVVASEEAEKGGRISAAAPAGRVAGVETEEESGPSGVEWRRRREAEEQRLGPSGWGERESRGAGGPERQGRCPSSAEGQGRSPGSAEGQRWRPGC